MKSDLYKLVVKQQEICGQTLREFVMNQNSNDVKWPFERLAEEYGLCYILEHNIEALKSMVDSGWAT